MPHPLCKKHGKPIMPSSVIQNRNRCWQCAKSSKAYNAAWMRRVYATPEYREAHRFYARSQGRKWRILAQAV